MFIRNILQEKFLIFITPALTQRTGLRPQIKPQPGLKCKKNKLAKS